MKWMRYVFCIAIVLGQSNYFVSMWGQAITNPKRSDGFGAQFQTIIYSVIYAELLQKKYVYTPFKTMEHNYNNDSDFLEKKERLINFIDYFEVNNGDLTVTSMKPEQFIRFFEQNLAQCINSASLQKIKNIFRANKNSDNYFNNDCLNIAIHIRRLNSHDNGLYRIDVPNDIYLEIINVLRAMYASKKPLFHLYSQGADENFTKFKARDIVLHINESVEDSFTSMVFADILVTAPSSFSYTAGILSDGIIYYIPFWHPPLPHWKVLNIFKKN